MTIKSERLEDGTIERLIPVTLLKEKISGWGEDQRTYQEFIGEDRTIIPRFLEEGDPVNPGDIICRMVKGFQYNNGKPVIELYFVPE